jgi:molybdopterin/thiamine biosynthesis adenylyltransferase
MESAVVLDVWGVLSYESFPEIKIIRVGKNIVVDTDYIDLENLRRLHA